MSALRRDALVVHLETAMYPDPAAGADGAAGTIWRASAEHDGESLVSVGMLQVQDPDVDSTGMVSTVLGDEAAVVAGKVGCFCDVTPGDLIVAQVNTESPQPNWPLLAIYAVQQAVQGLRSPAAHMTTELVPVEQVESVSLMPWPCGVSLTLAAAWDAGSSVEAMVLRTRRGLHVVS